MPYSLLLNLAVLACVLWLVRSIRAKEKVATNSRPGPATPADQGAEAERKNSPWTKRLDIEGVAPLPVNERGDLVRAFGMRRNNLIDLAVYAKPGALESFPVDVKGCLLRCYQNGSALGLEVMELACKEGRLEEGQGLYFALMHKGNAELPAITAFVGKM